MRALHTLAASVVLTFPLATSAQNFSIDWYTIDGGGGTSAGGNFSLSGTIGQPDAGVTMTNGTFSLTGGFWSLFAVQTPDAPRLTIRRNAQPEIFLVSWPSPYAGFVLQQNLDLNTTNWSTVPGTVHDNGTNWLMVVPSSGNRYYRLVKP